MLAVVACADDQTGPESLKGSERRLTTTTSDAVVTFDDMLARVAEIEPAFAGVTSSDILVTDISRASAAKAAVRAVFGRGLGSEQSRLAQYSFAQLYLWATNFASIASLPGVTYTDINEAENYLTIGIESEAEFEAVRQVLQKAGVPSNAFLLKVAPRDQSMFSLQDYFRGAGGGLRIQNATTLGCTMGFNAVWYVGADSIIGFATNSHCTSTRDGVDGTVHYQSNRNSPRDRLGYEYRDAAFFPAGLNCTPLSGSTRCKWSDLSLARYDFSGDNLGYSLAQPDVRGQWSSTITFSTFMPVVGETLWPLMGHTVDKIGSETGWTSGPVIETCVNVLAGSSTANPPWAYTYNCQYRTAAQTAGGDSGAAVFYYDPSSGATIVGQMHAGRVGEYFTWSSWNNIQSEFANLRVSHNMP